MFSRTHLSLPGGVELRGRPGMLEICMTASPGAPNERKTILRRSWLGGSRYASVETYGDRLPVDPAVLEAAEEAAYLEKLGLGDEVEDGEDV